MAGLFDEQEIDRRSHLRREEDRAALSLFADGKAEWLRWIVGLLGAIIMGWYGAQARLAALDAREQSHFEEMLRVLDRIDKRLETLDERIHGRRIGPAAAVTGGVR